MEDDEFLDELGKRQQFLESLMHDNVASMDDVQLKVLRFSGYDVVAEDVE